MHGEDEERKRTALEKLAAVGSRRTLLTCGNGMGSVVLKHRIALLGCLAFVHLDRGMMVSRVDCSDQRSRKRCSQHQARCHQRSSTYESGCLNIGDARAYVERSLMFKQLALVPRSSFTSTSTLLVLFFT